MKWLVLFMIGMVMFFFMGFINLGWQVWFSMLFILEDKLKNLNCMLKCVKQLFLLMLYLCIWFFLCLMGSVVSIIFILFFIIMFMVFFEFMWLIVIVLLGLDFYEDFFSLNVFLLYVNFSWLMVVFYLVIFFMFMVRECGLYMKFRFCIYVKLWVWFLGCMLMKWVLMCRLLLDMRQKFVFLQLWKQNIMLLFFKILGLLYMQLL